jgi:hypothetical protein
MAQLYPEQENYAREKAVSMLRRYICTKYEEDHYSDEKLIEDYIDIYNVAMDMFNYGVNYEQS